VGDGAARRRRRDPFRSQPHRKGRARPVTWERVIGWALAALIVIVVVVLLFRLAAAA